MSNPLFSYGSQKQTNQQSKEPFECFGCHYKAFTAWTKVEGKSRPKWINGDTHTKDECDALKAGEFSEEQLKEFLDYKLKKKTTDTETFGNAAHKLSAQNTWTAPQSTQWNKKQQQFAGFYNFNRIFRSQDAGVVSREYNHLAELIRVCDGWIHGSQYVPVVHRDDQITHLLSIYFAIPIDRSGDFVNDNLVIASNHVIDQLFDKTSEDQ